MKVIFISDNGQYHKKIAFNAWLVLSVIFLIIVLGLSISRYLSNHSLVTLSTSTRDEIAYQSFSNVMSKLSQLESQVQRLNALGNHIASRSKININDFGLTHAPAIGGRVDSSPLGISIIRKKDITKNVNDVENSIEKQKLKLKNLLLSLETKDAEEYLVSLSGKTKSTTKEKKRLINYDFSAPLMSGYISSPFGSRKDPINGSLRHHGGLDIAVKKGSNIYAIANGFVSFSGKRGAYGNLLEINHSESLNSRYAHLDSFTVKKGQLVKKGDLVGYVGDTGRVTGPHLHLEIRVNNKLVDPKAYLKNVLKNL